MVKFESLDPEIRGVLGKKVSELGLKVEGSPVEGYVRQLYKELERRGLNKFRPPVLPGGREAAEARKSG